ncbi:phospholipase D, partial [Suhomyces tanzawaensis NRRL Y-17324]
RPLREVEDFNEIHKSVSRESATSEKKKPKKKEPVHLNHESPKVVGNPWTFFNQFTDTQEARYDNEEQEEMDSVSYNGRDEPNEYPDTPNSQHNEYVDAVDDGQEHNSWSFFPFSRRAQEANSPTSGKIPSHVDDSNKPPKLMKRIRAFRTRKKDRQGKKSISAVDFTADEEDMATTRRAQALVGRLAVSADAIGLLASCLLEDERGIGRAPLLLTLLGFRITDTSPNIGTKIRRFRIDLEYGVGPQRLQWSVEKNAKDLLYLHSRFKFEKWRNEVRSIKTDLPKYPIPPLRNAEGVNNRSKSKNHLKSGANEELHEDNSSIQTNHTLRGHLANLRSQLSSINSTYSEEQSPEQVRARITKNQEYIKEVTNYLNDLITLVALRAQSNKLFQFFEISPLSSLLSYETGYIGKQGVIHLGGTAKSQGWRVGHFKANDLKGMIDRRSEKWLLIRNSYVMYVADINSTLPLDVFLVDSNFRITFKGDTEQGKDDEESDYDDSSLIQMKLGEETLENESSHKNVFQHLKITLENSERKMVLVPKSIKEQKLWIKSLLEMKNSTIYSNANRFGSFAPIRKNSFAQWFVDGRDYFWAVSSALEMAKDVIFIHDWWLSPELYLRRPANGNQQWRIDRILQRKAKQGVKIYVIVYRNVGTTVATDSLYTKHSILSLDEENIHVIRSPNQLLQNTYFWAHHEKLCIIDHTVAFLGGIDLCYGRYDTPDHVLTDDSEVNFESLLAEERLSPEDFVKFQVFPGKDYSNPRVKDFFGLDKPYESMYDRNSVPRMPWHDVHMVTSGKVARDLARHFVQRWNYLLRQKRPSRFTPLLTPPSDLTDEEVEHLGLNGTCEVQLIRSSGSWSLGLKEHEQSIQNAYLKLIETSEHFVYIENQFFITSCFIDGTEIKNRIGDALVDRIIKAHNEGTNWRAIIVIPLMPGFESQVDEPDGSSVRVIMQCQYMSISRGTTSIYAKLRKYGIEPDDYIQFFSLRKWGRIGPDRTLVTEQLYIHAKTMIVDDRVALIGSANINERSMRGVRDSEVAAVVRDQSMISTTMDGEPYLAAKFAHTLRMRLMREHLGVNVDILDIVERRFKRFEEVAKSSVGLKAVTNKFKNREHAIMSAMVEIASRDILDEKEGTFRWKNFQESKNLQTEAAEVELDEETKSDEQKIPTPLPLPLSFNNRTGPHEANTGIRDKKKHSYDARVQHSDKHKKDVYGDGPDKYKTKLAKRARLNASRFLKDLAKQAMKNNPTSSFLPDIHNVKDFLEADDFDIIDEIDEESEKLINERNKERWALLKKISYLQRVAAKEKEDNEHEAKRRVDAGMEPSIKQPRKNSSYNGSGSPEPEKISVNITDGDIQAPLDTPEDAADGSISEKEKKGETVEGHSEQIPIVTLDEQGTRDILQSINPKGDVHFSKYVDPYGFEDPLYFEFYEDLWYEHARRNTEMFRLIFHTQPDDYAISWKDYKHYSKLQRAFYLSQQQEAKERVKQRTRTSLSDESESEDEFAANAKSSLQDEYDASDNEHDDLIEEEDEDDDEEQLPEKAATQRVEDETETEVPTEEPKSSEADSTPKSRLESGFTASSTKKPRPKRSFLTRRRLRSGERIFDRDSAERILNEIQGHLVMFPVDWLMRELEGGNWFYNTDRIPPIEIYD